MERWKEIIFVIIDIRRTNQDNRWRYKNILIDLAILIENGKYPRNNEKRQEITWYPIIILVIDNKVIIIVLDTYRL
jgi:hypothetical protein